MAAILAAGCSVPEWSGAILPVAAQHDPCGSGAPTRVGRAAMHRLPYLLDAEPTAVTIAWAGLPDGAPRIAIARNDDPDRTVIATFVGMHPGANVTANEQQKQQYEELYEDYDEFYELAARVVGLDSAQHYCYRLVNDRGPLTEWASLTTAPMPDARRVDRFVVLGDSGSGSPAQVAIARRISRQQFDAILFLGDLAYWSGTQDELQARFFAIYADIFQRVPVYATIGNHDIRTAGGRPFEEALWLPHGRRWYAFDLGDVHFVVLDTTRIGREQAAWLDRELARDDHPFTVVLAHHPPFTSGWRGGSGAFRRWFVPVLERHRVELVLAGHDHYYERREPNHGIVYIISGGGGGTLTRVIASPRTARLEITHHFLVLEAHADRLVVRAIDIDGNVIDEVAIAPRR